MTLLQPVLGELKKHYLIEQFLSKRQNKNIPKSLQTNVKKKLQIAQA
jgi:hypothetical protein